MINLEITHGHDFLDEWEEEGGKTLKFPTNMEKIPFDVDQMLIEYFSIKVPTQPKVLTQPNLINKDQTDNITTHNSVSLKKVWSGQCHRLSIFFAHLTIRYKSQEQIWLWDEQACLVWSTSAVVWYVPWKTSKPISIVWFWVNMAVRESESKRGLLWESESKRGLWCCERKWIGLFQFAPAPNICSPVLFHQSTAHLSSKTKFS